MASAATKKEFVSIVAEEVSSGIDRALNYWLGRIELEVVDRSISITDRLCAIEEIIREYKDASGAECGCISA